MPPNVRLPNSISIALTPTRGFEQPRIVTIEAGQPRCIGRASRSSLKNLDSRRDNALFDCPVISRIHAELSFNPWERLDHQVTITDKRSMHGTRVNGSKLREGVPKTLHPGDIVQFGERVMRGDSSHEGVEIVFSLNEQLSQNSHTLPNPAGVYQYPYTSDEESEDESNDNISILSDDDEVLEVSSAKTTPEQAKPKLGTQAQPIELDQPEPPKRTIVQDSIDAEASVLVPESVPMPRKSMPTTFRAESVASGDWDAPSRRSSIDGSVHSKAILDDMDAIEDADLSDVEVASAHGRFNLDVTLDEGDDHSSHRSPSPAPVQPSPELRTSGQAPGASFTASHEPLPPLAPQGDMGSASRPAFDTFGFPRPISSSQPTSHTPYQAGEYPTTRLPGASRWDRPPPFYPPLRSWHYQPPPPLPSTFLPHGFGGPMNSGSSSQIPPIYPPPPFSSGFNGVDDSFANFSHTTYTPRSPKAQPSTLPAESRISIPDIVDDSAEVDGMQESLAPAAELPIEAFTPIAVPASATKGKKRKFQDDEELAEPAAPTTNGLVSASKSSNVDAAECSEGAEGPASKRIKTSTLVKERAPSTGVAAKFAKYAAAATVGGFATLALLSSPAGEMLETWLST